jgi:hypothetical protein
MRGKGGSLTPHWAIPEKIIRTAGCPESGNRLHFSLMEGEMKHCELDQLPYRAKINQQFPQQIMSREDRIQRWVELLEAQSPQVLSTLRETEFQPAAARAVMRSDNSAITVAFNDPILRASGLESDTYGAAKQFFQLSDGQLHRIVCYCHFGTTVSAAETARYIRAHHMDKPDGIWGRLRRMFA